MKKDFIDHLALHTDDIKKSVDWYIKNKEWWEKIPFELVKNPTPWK